MEENTPMGLQQESRGENIGNVHSLWVRNVYLAIKNLENTERLARRGCVELIEFCQPPIRNSAEIQWKNLEIYISDLQLILIETKKILEKKFYETAIKDLESASDFSIKSENFIRVITNDLNKTKTYILRPTFYKLLNILSSIRSQLLEELTPLFYVAESNQIEERL